MYLADRLSPSQVAVITWFTIVMCHYVMGVEQQDKLNDMLLQKYAPLIMGKNLRLINEWIHNRM